MIEEKKKRKIERPKEKPQQASVFFFWYWNKGTHWPIHESGRTKQHPAGGLKTVAIRRTANRVASRCCSSTSCSAVVPGIAVDRVGCRLGCMWAWWAYFFTLFSFSRFYIGGKQKKEGAKHAFDHAGTSKAEAVSQEREEAAGEAAAVGDGGYLGGRKVRGSLLPFVLPGIVLLASACAELR
jgi:hypothetical protein